MAYPRLRSLIRREFPSLGHRTMPECLRLEPVTEVAGSSLPTVRIFLGTAPAAWRAERLFVWSVLRHRDPARNYEIFFVKDMAGRPRGDWASELGKYAAEIPTWAGGQGRVIYNAVGYLYQTDPAVLFDLGMDGKAVLGSGADGTGQDGRGGMVSLIDCHALAQGNQTSGALPEGWQVTVGEADGVEVAKGVSFGIAGILAGEDVVAGPYPGPAPARAGSAAPKLWREIEAEADSAGFTFFTKDNPSDGYRDLVALYQRIHEEGASNVNMTAEKTFDGKNLKKHAETISKMVAESGAKTVLDYGSGKGRYYDTLPGADEDDRVKGKESWGKDVRVTCYDPGYAPFSQPVTERFGGVVTTDVVEHIIEEDIPWVLDEIFGYADKFVYIVAACYLANKTLADGRNAHVTVMEPDWWKMQVESAARRRPGVRWTLCTEEKTLFGKLRVLHSGG